MTHQAHKTPQASGTKTWASTAPKKAAPGQDPTASTSITPVALVAPPAPSAVPRYLGGQGASAAASGDLPPPGAGRAARAASPRFLARTADPAERQADAIGARIARDLDPSLSVGSGPLPGSVRRTAQKHLGVALPDVRLQAGGQGHQKATREGAIAVTEGSTVSFALGQLGTSTLRGRALLGHELTHVAQQSLAGRVAVQRQTPDEAGTDPQGGMTLAAPAGHDERMAQLAAMKEQLDPERATRLDLRARLDAVPQETSPQTEAEREMLREELRKVEEHLIDQLTAQIDLVDSALGALRAVMPVSNEPGGPDVPQALWDDLRQLETDRKAAQAERKALQRSRTRDDIRALQAQLDQLGADDPTRKELEERKKQLAESLSATAEHRAAPGTWGKGPDGRGYVVYAHSVKVGGSLPWRNNNPGNVQRSPNGADVPGVLGVDAYQHFIFNSEADGKNAIYLDLQNRRGGAGATLSNALRSYIAGSQKEEDLPENQAECERRGIPAATCVTKEAARTYAPKVTGSADLPLDKTLGSLTPAERSKLVDAILLWEGGTHGAKGTEYSCADTSAPQAYRDLLGCDE